jgi:hypothetical protein
VRAGRAGRRELRLVLSEPARLTLTLARTRPKARKPVARLVRRGVAGTNRLLLPRGLRPGSYRATVAAVDAAGNRSRAVAVSFRIAGSRKQR